MQLPPAIAAAIEVGGTVIASSARAARALRRLHGEAQRNRGLEAWRAPDILDWDSWLSRLWQKRLRSGGETRLLLTTLQEQQVWVRLVKPAIEGRRLISVLGVAELAQQAYALLCAYRALEFLRGERVGGPDVENFREWARGFTHTCSKEEWLSRSELPLVLHEAVLAGQIEATNQLVLTGFDRLTPAQQHLIDAFAEQGHSVKIAAPSEISLAAPPLLVEALGKRDEIATCALWVRQQLAAAAAEDRAPGIAVVVPIVSSVRSEIERIFRQILNPEAVTIGAHDLPLKFEFSLGIPLTNVPVARAALLFLRWMNAALLHDQLSWLMLSGFVCRHHDELLPIAEFDARLRRQPMRLPEQDMDTFLKFLSEGWQEAKPLDTLRHRLRAARHLLPQGGWLSFADWVDLAGQILDAAGWPGTHLLHSEDFQVQARWSQLLDAIAALAFDGRKVSYAEFIEVLEQQAGKTIFAPESQDAPVQILGPLEAAGLTFDAVWFLGADDISWPATANPHPFLSRSLQRKHRMPHADSTVDWELAQQVTYRLEQSAARCVFSYPLQNAEGACRPSPVVNSGRQKISANDIRLSIGAEEDLDAEHDFPALHKDDEQAKILPWPVEQDAGGSEILRRQAACPFQSFATRRLAAKPMDETDWGLEARERGSVVHRILETIWVDLKSRDGLRHAQNDARLHPIVEQHVVAALQRYRVRELKRSWSQAYLDAEQERIVSLIEEWLAFEATRAEFTVEAGEKDLNAAVGDLKLKLRVDRIDVIDGGRVILDYKTGILNSKAWDGPRPDDPQLPIYAAYGRVEDLKGVLFAQVRADEVKLFGRVENGDAVMPGDTKLTKPPYSAEMLQQWRQVLLELGSQFLAGEAQVDPRQYPKTCEFCPLPGLCRIAESDHANTGDDADESDGVD